MRREHESHGVVLARGVIDSLSREDTDRFFKATNRVDFIPKEAGDAEKSINYLRLHDSGRMDSFCAPQLVRVPMLDHDSCSYRLDFGKKPFADKAINRKIVARAHELNEAPAMQPLDPVVKLFKGQTSLHRASFQRPCPEAVHSTKVSKVEWDHLPILPFGEHRRSEEPPETTSMGCSRYRSRPGGVPGLRDPSLKARTTLGSSGKEASPESMYVSTSQLAFTGAPEHGKRFFESGEFAKGKEGTRRDGRSLLSRTLQRSSSSPSVGVGGLGVSDVSPDLNSSSASWAWAPERPANAMHSGVRFLGWDLTKA